jgi:hypothetical protein
MREREKCVLKKKEKRKIRGKSKTNSTEERNSDCG